MGGMGVKCEIKGGGDAGTRYKFTWENILEHTYVTRIGNIVVLQLLRASINEQNRSI